MKEAVVRPAREGDVEGVYAATYESWQSAYAGILDEEHHRSMQPPDEGVPESQRDWLETVIDHEAMDSVVAVADGAVAGFAELVWAPEHAREFVADDEAGLRALYLRPAYQGRGIGSRLLEAGLERLPDGVSAGPGHCYSSLWYTHSGYSSPFSSNVVDPARSNSRAS